MKFNSLQIKNLVDRFDFFCSETHYQLKDEEPKDYYIEYYIFQGELRKFILEIIREQKQWSVLMYVSIAVAFFMLGMLAGGFIVLGSF